jgi:hypothetical protein
MNPWEFPVLSPSACDNQAFGDFFFRFAAETSGFEFLQILSVSELVYVHMSWIKIVDMSNYCDVISQFSK